VQKAERRAERKAERRAEQRDGENIMISGKPGFGALRTLKPKVCPSMNLHLLRPYREPIVNDLLEQREMVLAEIWIQNRPDKRIR
jgi:hypothetical protein